jgi:hypothetical protein
MKRLAEFLTSVMPEDRAQLLFLAGTVCLVTAPRLSWWPAGFEIAPEHRGDGGPPVRRILSCIYSPQPENPLAPRTGPGTALSRVRAARCRLTLISLNLQFTIDIRQDF